MYFYNFQDVLHVLTPLHVTVCQHLELFALISQYFWRALTDTCINDENTYLKGIEVEVGRAGSEQSVNLLLGG